MKEVIYIEAQLKLIFIYFNKNKDILMILSCGGGILWLQKEIQRKNKTKKMTKLKLIIILHMVK